VNEQSNLIPENHSTAINATSARGRSLLLMIRAGCLLAMAAPSIDLLRFVGSRESYLSLNTLCDLINITISTITFVLSFSKWFARHWQPTVWIMAVAITASSTLNSPLGTASNMALIGLVLLIVGTGSLLPWASRMQASYSAVSIGCWLARSVWMPGTRAPELNDLITLGLAAALAEFSCFLRNRYMREQEASARRIMESQVALRRIFDANTDSITLIDSQTRRIVDINAQFTTQTGYQREEIIGKTAHEIGIWADPATEERFVQEVVAGRTVRNMEADIRLRDGTALPCLVSSTIVTINGRLSLMTNARDVTDRKRSRAKLEESEATLRRIFEAGVDAMAITEIATGICLDINEEFSRTTGYSREEFNGNIFRSFGLLPDSDQQQFEDTLRTTGAVKNQQTNLRTKNGGILPCLVSGTQVELWGKLCCISTAQNISELMAADAKLRSSEAMLREIFDSSLDNIAIIDLATAAVIDVNNELARRIGFKKEELIGKGPGDVDNMWADKAGQQVFVKNLLRNGEVRNFETPFRTRDGSTFPVLVSAVVLELGGRRCILLIARDVTDLKAAEAKLLNSEATMRRIFDAGADAMIISEIATGAYLDCNEAFVKFTGYSREEVIGSNIMLLGILPNEKEWQKFNRKLIRDGGVKNLRTEFRSKDGTIKASLLSGVVVELWGKPCCIAVARDITEFEIAEAKLRSSEAMLREIFDSSLDNISVVDLASNQVIDVNNELVRRMGYSKNEIIGKRLEELDFFADPARQKLFARNLIHDGEVRNFEMSYRVRDGSTFPGLVSAVVVELGGRRCVLSIARDVTDLEAARQAALSASRAKTEFLSSMSHEIRTPMNSILGMADLIGESELSVEQRRYLDTVIRNGNALLELINSILDLAKVESGRLSLEAVEFDLAELTERVADTLALRAHEKEVELALRFEPGVAPISIGDPLRLRQILTNLIGNAIKFTEHGEIVVTVGPNPDPAVPGNLLFSVRDSGIGIAPDKIDSIFSSFTQADSSTTRKYGGSGLGLAIVERLVALMGGRVWAESEPGNGSTFNFTIALSAPETPTLEARPIADVALHGVRALLVEDNATTRTIVREMLTAKGALVTETESGAQGLEAIENAHREQADFGLFLFDSEISMAGDFAMIQRARSIDKNAALVLLMSLNGLTTKLSRMRELDVRYYTTKPIKERELYAAIAAAMARGIAPAHLIEEHAANGISPSASTANGGDPPLKILLADDSPDNRLLVRAYLKKTGCAIDEAEDGQIALDLFVDRKYDLVLMDVQMPILDGYGAVRAIRKWELENNRKRTPIIALTASALDEDVLRAKEAGCDMHVSKPVKKTTLLGAIEHATQKPHSGASVLAADQRAKAGSPSDDAEVASDFPRDPIAPA